MEIGGAHPYKHVSSDNRKQMCAAANVLNIHVVSVHLKMENCCKLFLKAAAKRIMWVYFLPQNRNAHLHTHTHMQNKGQTIIMADMLISPPGEHVNQSVRPGRADAQSCGLPPSPSCWSSASGGRKSHFSSSADGESMGRRS